MTDLLYVLTVGFRRYKDHTAVAFISKRLCDPLRYMFHYNDLPVKLIRVRVDIYNNV